MNESWPIAVLVVGSLDELSLALLVLLAFFWLSIASTSADKVLLLLVLPTADI